MDAWKPDRILKLVVGWIAYLLIFSWLPLVRAVLDGSSYQWGTAHFGAVFRGSGFNADAWLLVFKAALLIFLIYGALRGANKAFRWILAIWSVAMIADVVHAAFTNPGAFEFHGDTLGIHVNLGLAVVAVVGGFSLLALYWITRERNAANPGTVAWSLRNTQILTALLLLLPVQFILLRFGEPHGRSDQIGVLITIAQALLVPFALYPWSAKKSQDR